MLLMQYQIDIYICGAKIQSYDAKIKILDNFFWAVLCQILLFKSKIT